VSTRRLARREVPYPLSLLATSILPVVAETKTRFPRTRHEARSACRRDFITPSSHTSSRPPNGTAWTPTLGNRGAAFVRACPLPFTRHEMGASQSRSLAGDGRDVVPSPGTPGSAPAPCSGMREMSDASGNTAASQSDCPVPEEYRGKHGIFNVYNTKIDSRNNMPATARQDMAPGQRTKIPTTRQPSTIPKSGTKETWTYPSPQMFYNSLVRKGKAEDCTEEDMASVVSVHNSMNEDTWRRVVTWERLHNDEVRVVFPKSRLHVCAYSYIHD
jgi:hypothetical protein